MSLNAAMIQMMVDKGMSGQDIADIAKAGEAKVDRTAAERQARHRAKRNAVTSRRDPPNDSILTPGVSPIGEPPNAERDDFPKPEGVSDQVWVDFLKNRKRKRLPNTATAYQAFLDDLDRLADDEWPPPRLVQHAAAKGWAEFTTPAKTGTPRMTANLPATTESRTPTLGLSLDAKLHELLLSADNPVVGPRSAAALRAFAAEPEPPLATEAEVETMIGKLAMATAQSKVSEAEAEERVAMYWLALKDLPVADLRAAFVELLRTKTFLPTPAEVRTAAVNAGSKRQYAKSRARHLVWKHEQEWHPVNDPVPPEELRELLANAKLRAA